MTKKQKTIPEIQEALTKSGGIISEAAKLLEITRRGLQKRIEKSEVLQKFRDELREEEKDLAEAIIHDALVAKDKDIAKWFLASQAKDRGFGNKSEVELKGKVQVEETPVDLSKLNKEELNDLEEILKKTTNAGTG